MLTVHQPRTEDNLWGWQSQTATATERAKHALSTEAFADITFRFRSDDGNVADIKAHKCILAMGSAVFEAMFFGSFAETRDTIPITDIDEEVFRIILRYIYHDQIGPFDTDTAFPTLYAAKKYGIPLLEHAVLDYLANSITTENCVSWLVQAHQYAEEEIQHLCMELIDFEASVVLQSEDFLRIDLAVLKMILCRDTLDTIEVEVYEAALRWAVSQCTEQHIEACGTNYRLKLDDAIGLIRFPLMTLEEIAAATESGLLSPDDVSELFFWHALKKLPSKFLTRQRQTSKAQVDTPAVPKVWISRWKNPHRFSTPLWNRDALVQGCQRRDIVKFSVSSTEYAEDRKDGILVHLAGFSIVTRDRYPPDVSYKVSAEIRSMFNPDERFEELWSFGASSSSSVQPCMFRKPFSVTLNTTYRLRVEITGMNTSAFMTYNDKFARQSAISPTLAVRFIELYRQVLLLLKETTSAAASRFLEITDPKKDTAHLSAQQFIFSFSSSFRWSHKISDRHFQGIVSACFRYSSVFVVSTLSRNMIIDHRRKRKLWRETSASEKVEKAAAQVFVSDPYFNV